MEKSQAIQLSNPSLFGNQLVSGISKNFRKFLMNIIDPKNVLKSFGMMGFLNINDIATTLVKSKLAQISEVKDFGYRKRNNSLELLAYINEPNEEAEHKIYKIYSDLLELFPSSEIDIKIVELYGRTKKEMQSLNL